MAFIGPKDENCRSTNFPAEKKHIPNSSFYLDNADKFFMVSS
jgi:hypothetical protein